jgi:hypothetical protein
MSKQDKNLSETCNIRLPVDLLSKIRQMANENERTFSGQIRWLLSLAVKQIEEKG